MSADTSPMPTRAKLHAWQNSGKENQEQGSISVREVQHQIKGGIHGNEKDYSRAGAAGVFLLHMHPESLSMLLFLISIC